MAIFYIDGAFVPAEEAVIPATDLAVLRGYGVFDLLRTYNGKPFMLNAHLTRLFRSAQRLGLPLPWSRQTLNDLVLETLARNDISDANVRIVVTGGSSTDFVTPQGKPRLLILVSPVPVYPDWWYKKGVKVITSASVRSIPDAKSIDYIPATIALRKARQQGAVEVIYMDDQGRVLEGTTSNLFMFADGVLITPGEGILSGVTRKVVLDVARSLFTIEMRDIRLEQLLEAGEVFITGTSKGIVPVVQVDDTLIGKGVPGPLTGRLREKFNQFITHYR
jgi:branched-chain amino acid aminotransferase